MAYPIERKLVVAVSSNALFNLEKEFVKEFSSARTFCFLHEVEQLREQGLIKGGNMDNAIVIVDRNIDDPKLRVLAHKLGIDH